MEVRTVHPKMIDRARLLGMGGSDRDVIGQLLILVKRSAPVRHPKGNRRNGQYVFNVNGGEVVWLHLIQCDACLDRHVVEVAVPCEECDCKGEDLPYCPNTGTVKVPCPDCTGLAGSHGLMAHNADGGHYTY